MAYTGFIGLNDNGYFGYDSRQIDFVAELERQEEEERQRRLAEQLAAAK